MRAEAELERERRELRAAPAREAVEGDEQPDAVAVVVEPDADEGAEAAAEVPRRQADVVGERGEGEGRGVVANESFLGLAHGGAQRGITNRGVRAWRCCARVRGEVEGERMEREVVAGGGARGAEQGVVGEGGAGRERRAPRAPAGRVIASEGAHGGVAERDPRAAIEAERAAHGTERFAGGDAQQLRGFDDGLPVARGDRVAAGAAQRQLPRRGSLLGAGAERGARAPPVDDRDVAAYEPSSHGHRASVREARARASV